MIQQAEERAAAHQTAISDLFGFNNIYVAAMSTFETSNGRIEVLKKAYSEIKTDLHEAN